MSKKHLFLDNIVLESIAHHSPDFDRAILVKEWFAQVCEASTLDLCIVLLFSSGYTQQEISKICHQRNAITARKKIDLQESYRRFFREI